MTGTSVSRASGRHRTKRFDARLTDEQRELFERAAALTGQPLTQFVVNAAQRAAEEAIRQHEIITLSLRDSRAVLEALQHPKPANDALRRAAQLHREMVGHD